MFVHDIFRLGHILFNMLGLLIFGIHVEKQMGSREFLLYYLLTGILAGVFSFIAYSFNSPAVPLIGASGAIFAVQLAYAVMFPDSIIYIWGILPLRAPIMVLGYTALELFFSLTGGGRGNVAHLTHLAGFAFGWIYFLVRFGVNPWRRLTGRY
jgi:membrane associated rhomboid family serine protease